MDAEFATVNGGTNGEGQYGSDGARDDNDEDKVLVERNGEFLFIPKEDLEALDLFTGDENNDQSDKELKDVESGRNPTNSHLEDESYNDRMPTTSCEATDSTGCTTSCDRENTSPVTHQGTPPPSGSRPDTPPHLCRTHQDTPPRSPSLSSHDRSSPDKRTKQVHSFVPPTTSVRPHRLASGPGSHRRPWTTGGRKTVPNYSEKRTVSTIFSGSSSSSGEEEKKSQNKLAFQEWLAKKRHQGTRGNQEHQRQDRQCGSERPSSALPRTGTWPAVRTNSDAFDSWLRRKQEEMKTQKDIDIQKKKESHEQDKSVDGEKAFQMYATVQ